MARGVGYDLVGDSGEAEECPGLDYDVVVGEELEEDGEDLFLEFVV